MRPLAFWYSGLDKYMMRKEKDWLLICLLLSLFLHEYEWIRWICKASEEAEDKQQAKCKRMQNQVDILLFRGDKS